MTQKGSLLGGTLLVAGCSIGAGMLAVPAITSLAGFQPSSCMLALVWLYMCCTGLLLLEVNLWFTDEISIVSMAERTLGYAGKIVGWIAFVFLFYSLLVSYVAGCGAVFSGFAQEFVGLEIPQWVGSLFFVFLFGVLIYLGTFVVDECNRILMLGLIVTYVLLLFLGLPHFNVQLLRDSDWELTPFVLPVMIVLFGFHNLVPTLTTYLHHDKKKLIQTIILGSLIPLLIYLLWEGLVLGLIPMVDKGGFQQALSEGEIVTCALRQAVGKAWVVGVAEWFAFFALITSLLSVALSFVDFLADGLKIPKQKMGRVFLCFLVLGLPFFCAVIYPNIFIAALHYAGFVAVVLFGLLPASMVWVGRYMMGHQSVQIVPGGRFSLSLVILFSLLVLAVLFLQKI